MRRSFIAALGAAAFAGTFLFDVSASSGAIILLSRTNRAHSSASNSSGSMTDTQPDQVMGTTLGTFSLVSNSVTPDTLTKGKGQILSDLGLGNDNGEGHLIDVLVSGVCTVGVVGGNGFGYAETIFSYQFTAPLTLQEVIGTGFGQGATVSIRNSANQLILSQPDPSGTRNVVFAADTYTFDIIASRPNDHGNSATVLSQMWFTVVPEPASMLVIPGLAMIFARRRAIR